MTLIYYLISSVNAIDLSLRFSYKHINSSFESFLLFTIDLSYFFHNIVSLLSLILARPAFIPLTHVVDADVGARFLATQVELLLERGDYHVVGTVH